MFYTFLDFREKYGTMWVDLSTFLRDVCTLQAALASACCSNLNSAEFFSCSHSVQISCVFDVLYVSCSRAIDKGAPETMHCIAHHWRVVCCVLNSYRSESVVSLAHISR